MYQTQIKPFFEDVKQTLFNIGQFQSYSLLTKIYAVLLMLFIAALLPLPYEFYISLRLLICLGLIMFVYQIKQRKTDALETSMYMLLGLIVLYNPLFVIHLGSKLVWAVVNTGTLYFLFKLRGKIDGESRELNDKQEPPEAKDKCE